MYYLSIIKRNRSESLSHLVMHIFIVFQPSFLILLLLFYRDNDELFLENILLNAPWDVASLFFSKKILLNFRAQIADTPASSRDIFGNAELKFFMVGLINCTRFPTRQATARHWEWRRITTYSSLCDQQASYIKRDDFPLLSVGGC